MALARSDFDEPEGTAEEKRKEKGADARTLCD
jgi:hypothetical protein